MAHSQGNWHFTGSTLYAGAYPILERVSIQWPECPPEECEANERLIEAAPEMHRVCQFLADNPCECDDPMVTDPGEECLPCLARAVLAMGASKEKES